MPLSDILGYFKTSVTAKKNEAYNWKYLLMSHKQKIQLEVCMELKSIFNRPGLAGAVLQSPSSFINSLIHWLIKRSFGSNTFQTLPILNRKS